MAKSDVGAAKPHGKKTARPNSEPVEVDNPLEGAVEVTGDLEKDISASQEAMLAAMKNKEWQKKLRSQMQLTCDSAYWVALCFETREQKHAFFEAMKMPAYCNKQYVDGVAVAKAMGIELPGLNQFPYKAEARQDKRLNALVDLED